MLLVRAPGLPAAVQVSALVGEHVALLQLPLPLDRHRQAPRLGARFRRPLVQYVRGAAAPGRVAEPLCQVRRKWL